MDLHWSHRHPFFYSDGLFFRMSDSTFNLEYRKCICHGNNFVYYVTGYLLYLLTFFELCLSQGFERNWKKPYVEKLTLV